MSRVSDATLREVGDFLNHEAHLLDSGAYRQWLELLDPEVAYRVPLRVVQSKELDAAMPDWATHVDDDLAALEMRVQRLESGYAWAEEPPSRVRRFVTNLRVEAREGESEVEASVNLLVSRTRGEDPTADLFAGERRDVLRKTATGWKLVSRLVLLDQAVLAGHFPTIL